MSLTRKRMGEIALLYVRHRIETGHVPMDNFDRRVVQTAHALNIPLEEARAFAKQVLAECDTTHILTDTETGGSA